ncbi:MAG TPA: hypothetical protein VG755_13725 [Nannocystaceae bacterium]|nr:hypothetical protein [Nannocystaceae bacterium]
MLRRAFGIVALVIACGDDEGTATSVGTSPTTSTTADGTSSSETGSASISSTTATVTSSESSSDGGSDPEPLDTSGESSGSSGDAVYGAVAVIGALDRIRITKRDDAMGTCVFLTVVRPDGGGQYDVTVTRPWQVESVGANDVPESCDSDNPPMSGFETATAAAGSIDLYDVGANGWPCTIDIAVELAFMGMIPPVPMADTMQASGLAVANCP